MEQRHDNDVEMVIRAPAERWPEDRWQRMRYELSQCPDVAFAHLPEVLVPEHQSGASRVLFIWFVPEALRSLRSALNGVAEIVARVLPSHEYLDVVVLNSAPELLEQVEGAGCLLAEPVAEERRRALAASETIDDDSESEPVRRSRWWWPFGS